MADSTVGGRRRNRFENQRSVHKRIGRLLGLQASRAAPVPEPHTGEPKNHVGTRYSIFHSGHH